MMEWIDLRNEMPWLGQTNIHLVDQAVYTQLCNSLARLGFEIFTLDGSAIKDEIIFFSEAAKVFNFPESFGENWDAFHDSFGDFGELKEARLAIIWRDATVTLQHSLYTFLKAAHELLVAAEGLGSLRENDSIPVQVEVFFLGRGKGFDKRPSD